MDTGRAGSAGACAESKNKDNAEEGRKMQLILVVGAADLLFLVLLGVGLAAIGLHAIRKSA